MGKLLWYDIKFMEIIPSMLYTRYGFVLVRYTPVAGLNQSGATYQNRTDIYWLEASHNSLYTNVAYVAV